MITNTEQQGYFPQDVVEDRLSHYDKSHALLFTPSLNAQSTTSVSVCSMTQGDDYFEREGRRILPKRLRLYFTLELNFNFLTTDFYDTSEPVGVYMIACIDTQPTSPATTVDCFAHYVQYHQLPRVQHRYRKRIKVLYEEFFLLPWELSVNDRYYPSSWYGAFSDTTGAAGIGNFNISQDLRRSGRANTFHCRNLAIDLPEMVTTFPDGSLEPNSNAIMLIYGTTHAAGTYQWASHSAVKPKMTLIHELDFEN